ncbi:hypothetical protein ACWGLF_36910 [Streptomyces puniciscabiei]
MAALDTWLCFEDEAGLSMTPPTARTWARRGRTPVIRVRGRSQRRFSVAALACYQQGERSTVRTHRRLARQSIAAELGISPGDEEEKEWTCRAASTESLSRRPSQTRSPTTP